MVFFFFFSGDVYDYMGQRLEINEVGWFHIIYVQIHRL